MYLISMMNLATFCVIPPILDISINGIDRFETTQEIVYLILPVSIENTSEIILMKEVSKKQKRLMA